MGCFAVTWLHLSAFGASWMLALYLQTFQLLVLLQPLATERWTSSAKGLTAAVLVKQAMFVFQ
jgi:hypothetical protein